MEKKILAVLMDRIGAFNGRDRKITAATRCYRDTVIDDDEI
jgi:hypothetical protein